MQDSPVFNYISSLSPIEQIKSIRNDRSFNSVNFTSPSSLFASPKIGYLRESRFSLSSNQSPDILKPELPLHGKENKISKGNSEAVQLFDDCTGKLDCVTPGSSAREVISKLLDETLELAIELPITVKYDGGTPVRNKVSRDVKEKSREPETDRASLSFVQCNEDNPGAADYFENKTNLRKICRIEQSEEVAGCDWVSLVSDAVLNSNLSVVENNSEDQDEKTVDTGAISFISTVLQLPQDNTKDLVNMVTGSRSCSCKQSEMTEPLTQPEEIENLKDTDRTPDILSSTLLDKLIVSDSREKMDNEEEKRCLDFEMVGARKKKVACESNCTSSNLSQADCKDASIKKHFVPSKSKSSSSSMVAGAGLHLNALAAASKDGKLVKCKTTASGSKVISMRICESPCLSLTSCPNLLNKSEERDPVPCGTEVYVVENAMQPSVSVGSEEFNHKHNVESMACKRCNCKRSKCLKLYCECFAAGLYCIEPCSCLDCFNKPIHEDKVLETRRQIELRNPLAFAPKVIRSTDSTVELGDEANKTPASARHKKGCNCKRSSCLKKYCECFQVVFYLTADVKDVKILSEERMELKKVSMTGKNQKPVQKVNQMQTYMITLKEGEEEHPHHLLPSSDISRHECYGSSPLAVDPLKVCTSPKTSKFFDQPKIEEPLRPTVEEKPPKILKNSFSKTSSLIAVSPNSKRVSPPHHVIRSSMPRYRSRRSTLISALSFPSVTPPREH
ncbi:CRC domain-containing protein TSO1 [Citrus sinensis]|uniref:CRC domain-containing protein TSO1 n=1 Tax=Citrus sinensis TaxID=2711 RepID=A0ACB8KI64_CITSI|nr:CRC domain-containing protein TSO1 [Citrus sinensis]